MNLPQISQLFPGLKPNTEQNKLLQQQLQSQQKINDLLEKSSQALTCGPTCQRLKVSEELKQKYLNAQTNLQTAPVQLSTAEKNYYTYTQGSASYDRRREDELKKKAEEIANTLKKTFEEQIKDSLTLNKYYNSMLTNSYTNEELLNFYISENEKAKKKLGKRYSDVFTNNRKTYYEQNAIDELQNWYNLWWYIYYILIIALSISAVVASYSMSKIKLFIIFVLLLFYPYYINYIIVYSKNLYERFVSLLPKNVYNNL
jgi:hypothetical protein